MRAPAKLLIAAVDVNTTQFLASQACAIKNSKDLFVVVAEACRRTRVRSFLSGMFGVT